jgi:hypothetical protein
VPKSRRNLIYPYHRLADDMTLSVSDLRLDGVVPNRDPIIADFRTADVSAVAPPEWTSVSLAVDAAVATDELEHLERERREPTVVVVSDCRATNLRAVVTCDYHGTGRWTGAVELHRTQVAGQVLLRAVLAARVTDHLRREIGESQVWTLHVDPPAIPIIEGNLPVRWINFSESDVIPESARKDAFFGDLSEDAPVVYLNSTFEGLPELLSDDQNRPVAELALREAEYRRIATSVWLGMFNVAAASVDVDSGEDDAEPALPSVDWQRSVLETLTSRMYDESEAEILRRIATARSGEESRDVQARAAAAIAQLVDQAGALKRRVRQLALAGADS